MASHIPYGYNIVDGKAVIDELKAEQVRQMYKNYLSGLALKTAASQVGIQAWHSSAGRMLSNKTYLGTKYYPVIIDKVIFDLVQEEKHRRALALGRIHDEDNPDEPSNHDAPPVPTKFWMKPLDARFQDPYKQAEFAYSLIEREVG